MKSNLSGAITEYQQMFKKIMNWDEPTNGTHSILGNGEGHHLYNTGWALNDMRFYGWKDNTAKNEREINRRIEVAYWCLLKSLAEAIGYDYEKYGNESSVYQYHLKNLDVDKILNWRETK